MALFSLLMILISCNVFCVQSNQSLLVQCHRKKRMSFGENIRKELRSSGWITELRSEQRIALHFSFTWRKKIFIHGLMQVSYPNGKGNRGRRKRKVKIAEAALSFTSLTSHSIEKWDQWRHLLRMESWDHPLDDQSQTLPPPDATNLERQDDSNKISEPQISSSGFLPHIPHNGLLAHWTGFY